MSAIYRDRNFVLIISGKFVSLLGNAIYDVGLMWYFLTEYGEKSGVMLAWTMVLGILPPVLLGVFIGSVIDRFNKKNIMIISDLISGFAILIITILMHFNILNNIFLLMATGLISLTASFVNISVNSIIPELFASENLYTVNSVNQFVERGTLIAGFSLGGALVGLFGVEKIFLFNAFSFIASAVSGVFIVYNKRAGQLGMNTLNFANDFKGTAKFIKENKNLFRITLLFSIVNFLWDPLLSIALPYVLKNSFIITAAQFGIIEAALPAGFCIGAVYFSRRKTFLENKYVLFYSILGVNCLLTLFSIPILFSDIFTGREFTICVFVILLVLTGILSASINISTSVTIQTCVPDGMLGKYWAFSRSISAGLVPVGASIIGMFIGKVPSSVFFIFSVSTVYIAIILLPKDSYAAQVCSVIKIKQNY